MTEPAGEMPPEPQWREDREPLEFTDEKCDDATRDAVALVQALARHDLEAANAVLWGSEDDDGMLILALAGQVAELAWDKFAEHENDPGSAGEETAERVLAGYAPWALRWRERRG